MVTSAADIAILLPIWTKAEKYLGLPNSIIEEPTDDLTKKFKDFSKSHADQPNVVIVHQGGMIPYPVSMFHIIMHLCSAFSDIYGFFLQFHGFTLVKRAPSPFS